MRPFWNLVVVTALAALGTTACVQMPTEKQNVVNLQAQISFTVANERLYPAQVLVDGLPMGSIGDYQTGTAALRIKPGSHVIQVLIGSQKLLDEKVYVGDGVTKTFDIR